jgi:putative tryptophan/tyrosine transport system substrate-binding protein
MSTSIARIGILSPVTEAGMKAWWSKLKEGLEERG